MINVVLYEPENPHNTGAIVRTCALLGAKLHLVKPYGFAGLDGDVRRSSMSYLDVVNVSEYDSWESFARVLPSPPRLFAFWDEGRCRHDEADYADGDYLLFGRESVGLPDSITAGYPTLTIAMPGIADVARTDHRQHSLNLSVAVGIAVAEANRVLKVRLL